MILASVITYELSKRLGKKKASELFHTQAAQVVDTPGEEVCAQAVNVVRRLRRFREVALLHDAGGTSIGTNTASKRASCGAVSGVMFSESMYSILTRAWFFMPAWRSASLSDL